MLGMKKRSATLGVEGKAEKMLSDAREQLGIVDMAQLRINHLLQKEKLAAQYWSNSLNRGMEIVEDCKGMMSYQDLAIANDFMTLAQDTIAIHQANVAKHQTEFDKVDAVAKTLRAAIRDLDLIGQRAEVRQYLEDASSETSNTTSTFMSQDDLAGISESVLQATAFVRGMKELH